MTKVNSILATHRRSFWVWIAVTLCLVISIPVNASQIQSYADKVLVKKSEKLLYLINRGQVVKTYPIVLGKNPSGHKRKEGDGRTPEGAYKLDWRNPDSRFYRSIHISYPNDQDLSRAEKENADPGELIMIHGSPRWVPSVEWAKKWLQRDNWTDGCIAVTNDVMDEIWHAVKDGTPIEILP